MKQKCMILQKSVIAFRGVLLYDICMKRNADSPINRRCISPLSARLSSCRRDFFAYKNRQHLHAVLPVISDIQFALGCSRSRIPHRKRKRI